MRLKTLTIKGFKSFANETVINFNEEVIGIVGPNGSGKSNIVDAIRWVLGEQKSKELRLDKMTSVIFNGTKKKKPGGAASVSLTFENTKNLLPTEYHTVTITRILYRSGESEYQLNNVTCRLKDITSLFLDTGIGSNSYAIIALGMVDDLLNDKDNSRRRMFEQAAGISKYKKRKHQTLLKLKNTKEDLDRIEDVLFEIDGNLKQLEKQAKRTKRYFELKEKYKNLSVDLAVIRLSDSKGTHDSVTSKLQKEEDRYRTLEVEIRGIEATLEGGRKQNLDKEKELSNQQRALNELIGQVRGQENDKKILIQRRTFVEENIAKLTEQISDAESRTEQLFESIQSYQSQVNAEKILERDLEDDLDLVEKNLKTIRESHGNLKTELEDFIQNQQQLEREIFELEKQTAINFNQIENLQRNINQNRGAIDERKKEIDVLDEKLKVLKEKEKTQADKVARLEHEEAMRQKEIASDEENLEVLRKTIADVNRKLDAQRNEYKLTKSMIENLEGFPESIRFLSKNKDWGKEALLLSDLIYCKEDYRVAIENYLSPYLNYFVVEKLEDAYRAIHLLNKTQKGKANFFVLDAIKNHSTPVAMHPNTQRAIELVETDPPYRNLVNHLLQNVLVTDSDDLKIKIQDENIVLLSKSGQFVKRKLSISGGSVGLFEGKKIGRKKNLEVLDVSIKSFEKKENTLASQFYSLRTKIENLKAEIQSEVINTERRALNQLSQEKVSLMTRLENFEAFLNDANNKQAEAEKRIQELQLDNERMDKMLADKKTIAQEAKNNMSNTDESFRKVAEQLGQASAAFNEKNIAFIRQQNKVTTLQRELSFREKQKEETAFSLSKNSKTLIEDREQIEEIRIKIEELEAILVEAYEVKKEREASLSTAEQNYFQARGGLSELEDKLRTNNRQLQECQVLITNLKDNFNEMKLSLASIGERLKIEFNIALEDVMSKELDQDYDVDELQLQVEKLKKRLDNYGEINPMAVEAYDEMKLRYDNITSQRDDIVNAQTSLLETIKEIEDTATEQFMTAFDKVRVYFMDVFRSLFSEDDKCDLVLTDPDNPLESNINIIAKPKGKRPQSISQLSGGEKTLTAIALLFALYLLKPAPFCVFDEVDAPLDDTNIEKFNKIIKRFSKDSQFIIVTHNKATMAAVDVIYGVFMHEQGVSGVSAVDFREVDHQVFLETAS